MSWGRRKKRREKTPVVRRQAPYDMLRGYGYGRQCKAAECELWKRTTDAWVDFSQLTHMMKWRVMEERRIAGEERPWFPG